MQEAIFLTCGAVAWAAAVYTVVGVFGVWSPARFTLGMTLGLVGLVFTLSAPTTSATFDQITGIPNLAAFVIHVAVVSVSFGLQILMDCWGKSGDVARRIIARRLWVLFAIILLMANLFPRRQTRWAHFLVQGAQSHTLNYIIYAGFYLGALAVGAVTSAWMCWNLRQGMSAPGPEVVAAHQLGWPPPHLVLLCGEGVDDRIFLGW